MHTNLRRSSLAAVLVVLLTAIAGTAVARSAGTLLTGTATGPASTDGTRHVAWIGPPGMLHVLDATSGSAFDVDVRGDCLTPPTKVMGVGGGKVLFLCPRPADAPDEHVPIDEPRLLDIARRAIEVPVGARQPLVQMVQNNDRHPDDRGFVQYVGVGAYGLRLMGKGCIRCGDIDELVDWRTGRGISAEGTATMVPDLDSPSLFTTLCRPLVRPPWDDPTGSSDDPRFERFSYARPLGLWSGPKTPLSLQRCGSSRKLVLWPTDRLGATPTVTRVGADSVVWSAVDGASGATSVHAYLLACRARLDWPRAQTDVFAGLTGAIVSSEQPDSQAPWTLRRVPLSHACPRLAAAAHVRVVADRRTVDLAALSVTVRDLASGASATPVRTSTPRPSRLPVGARARLSLTFGLDARSVRGRLGNGRMHAASGHRRHWSLRLPRLGRRQTLALDVRFAQGGAARFVVVLRPARG